jgi:hypothetical protein
MKSASTISCRTCAFVVAVAAGIGIGDAGSQEISPSSHGTPPTAAGQRGNESRPASKANQGGVADPQVVSQAINPLWVRPLSSLSPTRERPIFSRSRRAAQVAAPSMPAPSITSPGPVRPPLTLVGAVAAGSESVAILRDETSQELVELRTGEGHAGWVLRSVAPREATLQKGNDSAIVTISVP